MGRSNVGREAQDEIAIESSAGPTMRPKIFRGWYIVASGLGLMWYTTGVGFYGFSAFFDHIADSVAGGSRAVIGFAVSVQRAESGIMSPVVGFLVDRLDPRIVLVTGFLIAGTGFILVSRATNIPQFFAAYLVLALGLGAGSFLVVSTSVSNWFDRKRGRALSFVFLGPAFAGFVVYGIVWLIEATDWRTALAAIGVGTWVICIPLSLVFRRRPEELGLLPDGDVAARPSVGSSTAVRPTSAGAPAAPPSTTIGAVLRTRTYWQYVMALAIQQAGFSALVIYQIPALKTFGIEASSAALVVLAWTLGSIPGRLGSGFLSDAMDKRLVFAGSTVLQLAGIILFLNISSLPVAFLYALVHGAGWGALTPSRLALQGEYWGRAIFGRLMGLQMGLSAVGGIGSPVFVGWMFDITDSYKLAFAVMFAPLLVCVALIMTMKRPVMPPVSAAPATA